MATLPAATDFTGASITEAQFKTAITDLRTFLADQLGTAGDVATALNTLGALCNDYITKSAAYTVVAADRGKLFGCTGTFDLSLTAAATLGDGFSFAVRCVSGTLTINPSGAELIDGEATLALAAGESCIVVCTGAAFNTIGRTVSNGQFQTMQVYAADTTWNKPSGLKRVKVTVVGGGGGSGGSNSATSTSGGGGGGGGCSVKVIEAASLLSSETVTVGAAGSAGAIAGNGGAGGTSSFGSYLSATGGGGGVYDGAGGAGGIGSGGNLNMAGGGGGAGYGKSKDSVGSDINLGGVSGAGGNSFYGGGAQGTAGAAVAGRSYGGGASGASGAVNAAGAVGAAGVVIVEEFF